MRKRKQPILSSDLGLRGIAASRLLVVAGALYLTFQGNWWALVVAGVLAGVGLVLAGGGKSIASAIHLLIDIFVAVAFGLIVVLIAHDAPNSSPGTPATLTAQQIVQVSLVFIVVFSAQVVARGTQSILSFEDATSAVSESSGRLAAMTELLDRQQSAIVQARLAGVAAKLMKIRGDALKPGGRHYGECAEGLEASMAATRAWVEAANRIPVSSGQKSRKIAAWWKLMATYYQEETFDISDLEVATNVRNYAYILLSTITSFLPARVRKSDSGLERKSGPPSPSTGSLATVIPAEAARGELLVIAQVTPFAPKDFFNFPNGRGRTRFYHEAEFFGNYRRVLSYICRDRARVMPMRIFLVEEKKSSSVYDASSGVELGWELEPLDKVAIDCARMHIVPVPFSARRVVNPDNLVRRKDDQTASGALHQRSNWENQYDESPMLAQLEARFPWYNHPAVRLPPSVGRWLWCPLYVHFGGLERLTDHLIRDKLIQRAYVLEEKSSRIDSWIDIDPIATGDVREHAKSRYLAFDNAPHKGTRFQRADQAFRRSFGSEYLGHDGRNGRLQARRDELWDRIAAVHTGAVSGNTDGLNAYLVGDETLISAEILKQFQRITNSLFEDDELRCHLEGMRKVFLLGKRLTDAEVRASLHDDPGSDDDASELADIVVQLVGACQELDAGIRYFRLTDNDVRNSSRTIASTGVGLGLAEEWLHCVLVQCEAIRHYLSHADRGPLPLWYLVAREILGAPPKSLPDPFQPSGRDFEQAFRNAISPNLTMCVVDDEVRRRMEDDGISPEFMLVGTYKQRPDSSIVDPEDVDWHTLIATSLSEPFHTCRVIARFDGYGDRTDSSIRSEFERYRDWFKATWKRNVAGRGTDEKSETAPIDRFIDLLAEEVNLIRQSGRHH